jgi:hypothetical protein
MATGWWWIKDRKNIKKVLVFIHWPWVSTPAASTSLRQGFGWHAILGEVSV